MMLCDMVVVCCLVIPFYRQRICKKEWLIGEKVQAGNHHYAKLNIACSCVYVCIRVCIREKIQGHFHTGFFSSLCNFDLESTWYENESIIHITFLYLQYLHCGRFEVSATTTLGTPRLANTPLTMPQGNQIYFYFTISLITLSSIS